MTVRSRLATAALGVALVLVILGSAGTGFALAPSPGPTGTIRAATTAVTGNVTGPTILSTGGNGTYRINATGGPAFVSNGTKIGTLSYYASVGAANVTGITISPASANFTSAQARPLNLSVSSVAEEVTITVMVSSVYQKQNQSINLTYAVHIVVPYVVSAEIVNGANTTVLSFPVVIDLDGSPVGTVTVPELLPNRDYNLSFRYPTLGLSSGEHTFSISLTNEHGLVRFSNGLTTYSTSFYVTSAAPNDTLWYVTGVVAFFGVLFIFATRVAARRRGVGRR